MTRSLVLAATLLAAPAVSAAPIIGGSADAADPAVVLLAAYPADMSTVFTCSAVVIAPRHLLTAAHCVDHAGYTFGVFYGAVGTGQLSVLVPELAAVTAVHIAPGYSRTAPYYADIALVDLAADAPAAPLPYARTAPTAAMVGTSVRIVGYGEIAAGSNNASRYAATTAIAAIDPMDTVTIGDATHHTCIGDSGGPALLATGSGDVVIGVDSYTDTTGCTGPSHFRRPDAFLAFIDDGLAPPAAADAGPGGDAGSAAAPGGTSGCSAGADSALNCAPALGLVFLGTLPIRRRKRAFVR